MHHVLQSSDVPGSKRAPEHPEALTRNRRVVGKLFDKDFYIACHDDLLAEQKHYWSSSNDPLMDQILRSSVAWDDPDYLDAPYPPDLQDDLDGDGITETTGDYYDVVRKVRGAQLARVPLSTASWQTIYLRTNRTDYGTGGLSHAPHLFIRGNVKGKAVIVYDVTDDTLDPGYDRLHTYILGQDEDPSDAPANRIAPAGAPGVSGGVRYDDPNVKLSKTQPVHSQDGLFLLSRGSVHGWGDSSHYRERIRDATGALVNYEDTLKMRLTSVKTT